MGPHRTGIDPGTAAMSRADYGRMITEGAAAGVPEIERTMATKTMVNTVERRWAIVAIEQ